MQSLTLKSIKMTSKLGLHTPNATLAIAKVAQKIEFTVFSLSINWLLYNCITLP